MELKAVEMRDPWGAFGADEFRIEERAYATLGKIPFSVCGIDGLEIAIVHERPISADIGAGQKWIHSGGAADPVRLLCFEVQGAA